MGDIWENIINFLEILFALVPNKPVLKYDASIRQPLINHNNIDKNTKQKLKFFYDNKKINQLTSVRITIYNLGTAIAEKFSSSIKIRFNKKILHVQPDDNALISNIITKYDISDNNTAIEFIPDYINQGENIYFDIELDGSDDIDIMVTGRCKGCSRISKLPKVTSLVKTLRWITALFIVSTILTYIYYHCKLDNIENRLDKVNTETISNYERLLDAETLRADTICAESKKVCAECKSILLDKLNEK